MNSDQLIPLCRFPFLNVRHIAYLLLMYENPPNTLSIRHVAFAMDLKRGSVSRILDNLCIAGLTVRSRGEQDQRDMFCALTERGIAVAQRLTDG